MSQLIVVGFKKDLLRASHVLNELQELNDDWVADLHDAVAAYRDYGGKVRIDQSYQMTTGVRARWGNLMGSLIGLTLANSFTRRETPPGAEDLVVGALAGGVLGVGAGAFDVSW
jgi:Predicted membrane protein